MNDKLPTITATEIAELIQVARNKKGGKATKYTSLETYRTIIIELMEKDIQLPIILQWLKDKYQVDLVLNTLRKYIVKRIGREIYEEYLSRNGWKKTRRIVNETTEHKQHQQTAELPSTKSVNTGLCFDLAINKPTEFIRTPRN